MKRILLFEDDFDTAETVKLIFSELDYEIITCTTYQGVQDVITISPDIIITDYLMEKVTGDLVCYEIKNHDSIKHIPVILFSATIDLAKRALICGADAFIEKPFNVKDFQNLVTNLSLK